MPEVTLGQVLRWHRSLCRACTARRPCPEYREICEEFTVTRQIYAGSVAPHTVLSVREGAAT